MSPSEIPVNEYSLEIVYLVSQQMTFCHVNPQITCSLFHLLAVLPFS